MTAFEVRSLNRHMTVEISHHFTAGWVKFEMDCRRLCGHSAIQSRQVELKPAPWSCEQQVKPKRGRTTPGGGQ